MPAVVRAMRGVTSTCPKDSLRRGVHGCLVCIERGCKHLFILLNNSAGVIPTHVGGSERKNSG